MGIYLPLASLIICVRVQWSNAVLNAESSVKKILFNEYTHLLGYKVVHDTISPMGIKSSGLHHFTKLETISINVYETGAS